MTDETESAVQPASGSGQAQPLVTPIQPQAAPPQGSPFADIPVTTSELMTKGLNPLPGQETRQETPAEGSPNQG